MAKILLKKKIPPTKPKVMEEVEEGNPIPDLSRPYMT
jgi:hypothetical protein